MHACIHSTGQGSRAVCAAACRDPLLCCTALHCTLPCTAAVRCRQPQEAGGGRPRRALAGAAGAPHTHLLQVGGPNLTFPAGMPGTPCGCSCSNWAQPAIACSSHHMASNLVSRAPTLPPLHCLSLPCTAPVAPLVCSDTSIGLSVDPKKRRMADFPHGKVRGAGDRIGPGVQAHGRELVQPLIAVGLAAITVCCTASAPPHLCLAAQLHC
jgi:hypothetical protein